MAGDCKTNLPAESTDAQQAQAAHDGTGQEDAGGAGEGAFLKSISSRLAARVPVQAPVPGRGIPTNSSSAQYSPRPALAWSLRPAFSPFSRQKVKNFPIYLLSFPHTSTFRAKNK